MVNVPARCHIACSDSHGARPRQRCDNNAFSTHKPTDTSQIDRRSVSALVAHHGDEGSSKQEVRELDTLGCATM